MEDILVGEFCDRSFGCFGIGGEYNSGWSFCELLEVGGFGEVGSSSWKIVATWGVFYKEPLYGAILVFSKNPCGKFCFCSYNMFIIECDSADESWC